MPQGCTADNTDPLYANYFQLSFGRGTRQLELMVQKCNLPGLTIPDQGQPTIFGTTVPVPTMAAQFETLNIEFIVDKQLTNWKSLFSWMRNLSNIQNDYQYNIEDYQNWHHTATLKLMSTDFKYGCTTVVQSVTFAHIIPVKLSSLTFQSDSPDAQIVKASCIFKYSYYTLDPDASPNLSGEL